MESKVMEQYLSRLKRALTCSRPDRERLLSQGQRLLENFLGENPEGGYESLVTAFGPPEVFAGEMLGTLDQRELEQTQARRKWLLRGGAVLAAVALVLCVVFWFVQWKQLHKDVTSPYYNVPGEAHTISPEEFKALFGVYPEGTN
ncbi:MAG: hypothetical protein K2F83_00485 [Oscillospiraceae bacterium]|nr:hypothetical protein [Oscillospiraceae bacterium]